MASNFHLDLPAALVFIAISFVAIFCQKRLSRNAANPRGLPLPPGPPPRLFVGNHYDIPATKPWIKYTNWGKQYGPLIHFRIFGQHVVIINSKNVASDLFEKRSHIYSDRPGTTMVDLMGWDFNIGLMPYSDKWRKHRRTFHQSFRPAAAVRYRPTQTRKVHDFLRGLMSTPEEFMLHIRTLSAAIVMFTMYGHDIEPTNDHFVTIAEQAVGRLGAAMLPGAVVVNALPILRYLPSWLPGIEFKRFADQTMVLTTEMQNVPFDFVRKNMKSGAGVPCLASELLEANDGEGGSKEQEDIIKRVTATSYAAGADTTVSAIGTFIMAMVLHPEVLRKAQEEIDNVVGTRRLPDFEDRPSLPYVEAIYREVMRWRPVLPLGVPHAASDNDVYNGYFIPKGAEVISNVWAMAHDESIYQQPASFMPERFFNADGQLNDDNTILAFGFGRRVCVGRYMAEATVWAAIVSVLSTFDLAKAKDNSGNEIRITGDYSDGTVSHPHPFQCSITPRSAEARRLVEETRIYAE